MLRMMAEVVYVHPYNHVIPDAIPVGAVGAINGLRRPVLGRYAEELSARDLADAKVALVDAHWFLATGALAPMLAQWRAINPRLQVVCGGLTASFYKQAFLDQFDVDWLVAGDVEDVLAPLVDALVAGESVPPLANVWGRGRPPPSLAVTSRADFDALDWLTLDWFPTYRARVAKVHAEYLRRGEPVLADNCHPILPLTRGCRRSCHFCYGAYQQEVFGPRVRMRTPTTLYRDLQRIATDPALHFVSLYFADAMYAEAYAPQLEDRRLPLDAFLFLCGAIEPKVLARLRSGFAGHVTCVFIQPRDLAPVRGRHDRSLNEQTFARTLRSFAQLPDSRAEVFHVVKPLAPLIAEVAQEGVPVRPLTVLDWTVHRPDLATLAQEGGPAAQLKSVTMAARRFASAVLVRTLVPALGERAIPDPFDMGNLEHAQQPGLADPTERAVVDLLVRQIADKGVYGFDDVALDWVSTAGAPQTDWAPPGHRLPGACAWTLGLNGAEWRGTVDLAAEQHVAVAPLPVILPTGAGPALEGWSRTQVPALELPAGPQRTVAMGGRCLGSQVLLWAEDRGQRREVTLRDPRLLPPTARTHATARPQATVIAVPAELRGLPSPHVLHVPWPDQRWPSTIVRHAAALTAYLGPLQAEQVSATHLDLYFGDLPLRICVFPRHPEVHLVSGGQLSVVYLGQQRAHFDKPRLAQLRQWLSEWTPP
jgi:hypothetical protein